MSLVHSTAAALLRAVLGGCAGAIACLTLLAAVCQAFSYYLADDSASTRLLVAVAGSGGTAGALLGCVFGARQLRVRVKAVAMGLVTGCLVGILGAVAYAALATGSIGPPFWGKGASRHRVIGLAVGVPVGCLLGGIAGAFWPVREEPPGEGERN